MSYPEVLTSPTQHESIVDALYRCIIGLDTNDEAMFVSAWSQTTEPSYEMLGTTTTGLEALKTDLFGRVSGLDTHHNLSNVRVDVRDGNVASMTANAIAQHHRLGEGVDPEKKGFMSGATYFVDVVREGSDGQWNGPWRIKKWVMKIAWLEGDRSVMGM